MNILEQFNQAAAAVVSGVLPTLVQIDNGRRSGGAGAIWRQDGLILTNAHVVAPSLRHANRPQVTLSDGRSWAARILAFDEARDLAALKIDAQDLPALELGDARQVRPGDWVTALGHPWGVRGAATAGAVIAIGRPASVPYQGEMIQVGLHMRPGHSGGALVDREGRLVGINCMIAGPDVGLAIPVNTAIRFLRDTLWRQSARDVI